VSIPQADLATRLSELPKDRDLLLVCAGGARSLRAAQFLRAVGYERVTSLDGGTNAWLERQQSGPVRR
jgi:rhodanese-related sulfurtransferase